MKLKIIISSFKLHIGTSCVLDELLYDEKFWLKVKMKDLLHQKEMIAPSLGRLG